MRPLRVTPLDDLNARLLLLLLEDGRRSHVELAELLGVSRPTVIDRCKRMETEGIVDGYSARVKTAVFGRPLLAFVAVTYRPDVDAAEETRFLEALEAEPDILEAHSVAGTDAFLLKVCAADPVGIADLLHRIRDVGLEVRTRTTVVLETHFQKPGPGYRRPEWREPLPPAGAGEEP